MSKLYRHVVDCETGEAGPVEMTDEEQAAFEAHRAILAAEVPVDVTAAAEAPDLAAELRALRAEVDALKAGGA